VENEKNLKTDQIAGTILGNLQSAENFADNVVLNAERGHGFAAEKANHLYDLFHGEDAQIIGSDNAKNGADRLVNGVEIQTKFCNSGSKCISECFENGKFRYWTKDGNPMQIEVPKDFHHAAKDAFIERVKKGQVIDISNMSPEEIKKTAENLADKTIKESPFTYAQARNIAKFGTIESLTYDAANGIKLAGTSAGISFVLSFAQSVWAGEDFNLALKNACYSGIKVGGVAWIGSIATAQLGRTATVQALRPATDWIIGQMGNRTAAAIANTVRIGSKPIYGAAAANSASKLLRGNVVTGAVTVAVLSSVDFYRMFQGRVSGAQVFKNVTNTAAGVAGGTAGWMGGAAIGASIGSAVPIVGTAVGGIIGGILGSLGGGAAAGKVSSMAMNAMITDDMEKMQEILGSVFSKLAEDYMLSAKEAENVADKLKEILSADILRDMFQSNSRNLFAQNLIEPLIVEIAKSRPRILLADLPTNEQIADEVEEILEENLTSSEE